MLRLAGNHRFRAGGKDYVFLANSSAIYELDPPTRNLLERLQDQEVIAEDDLNQMLASDKERSGVSLDYLLSQGVLERADEKRPPMDSSYADTELPLSTLVLQVTNNCNLSCSYCYHQGADRRTAEQSPMDWSVAQKGIDFLFERSGDQDKVVLVFFGGEPLLNFPLIQRAMDYARGKADEYEGAKQVSFALTTNGTLLSDEIIQALLDNQVSVTISIDGQREVHDQNRRFANGSPTYDALLPKLKNLLTAESAKPVVARVTLVKGARDISGTLDHLLGLGFAEAGLSPVTSPHSLMHLDESGLDGLLSAFGRLAEKFYEAAREDRFLGFSNLIDLLVSLHQGEYKTHPCGAGLSLFSLNTKGKLFVCQRLVDQDGFCMGDLEHGFSKASLQSFRSKTSINHKQECGQCWVRGICAGGCYHEALERQGDFEKPNRHYCKWIRNWTEIGLSVYGKLQSQNPAFLDKLALYRGHNDNYLDLQ